MGTIFFSDFVCCGTNLTCINTLTVICVILNPLKPMSSSLGSNPVKNPQEATAELFDALCVDLQIEAFAECLKGKSKSNDTLQTVSDLYEQSLRDDQNVRIVATDKEIEELMLKSYKELFELLDEAERSKVVQITRKVTMLLDLNKPPSKETLTHNVQFILQDIIRDIEHYS
ncbi:Taf19 TFIID subunit [Candida orthopsilosis Co 90-125]|uniref:Taf19 TFIID subunit n=1 Tax=Candida orthopsilosis (strain 90-125) TaxID=1136231 RepID=H8XAB6_CANO9|nr:Taf19 TFIID subunit [Candida orthopsilosis Co 90-125]CCG25093.1 Taf19 TFIID subunit [Candida orthopsilosis Co 90-125]